MVSMGKLSLAKASQNVVYMISNNAPLQQITKEQINHSNRVRRA